MYFCFWEDSMKKDRKFSLLFAISVVFIFLLCSCTEISDSQTSQARVFTQSGSEDYVSAYQVESSAAENQSVNLEKNWYKSSSFYYIWINDFYDSNGDGYGDLVGITQKLDYIQNVVGCDAILISPFFSCDSEPSDEYFTYDTTDFYSINSKFGTEYDLEQLITQAHKKGMKIIFDFAPNSTSKSHPWFVASTVGNRSVLSNLVANANENISNAEAKKDWYVWSDENLYWDNGRSKDNWYSYDKKYYYSAFSKDLPDLNFYNIEVRAEVKNIVRYWLNKGFDGLRIDSVRYLIEESNVYVDSEKTHEYISEIRAVLDEYESQKFLVADTKIKDDRNALELYFGTQQIPEFNMLFDYDAMLTSVKSVLSGKDFTTNTLTIKAPFVSASFANYLGATDDYFNRIGYIFKDNEDKINQTVALNLLRTSVPFVYFGNELALDEGAFDWSLLENENGLENSTLMLTRKILLLRNLYPVLRDGTVSKLSALDNNKSVLAYTIKDDNAQFICLFNFSEEEISEVSFYQNKLFSVDDLFCSVLSSNDNEVIQLKDDAIIFKNLLPNSYKLYAVNNHDFENSKNIALFMEEQMHANYDEPVDIDADVVDADTVEIFDTVDTDILEPNGTDDESSDVASDSASGNSDMEKASGADIVATNGVYE